MDLKNAPFLPLMPPFLLTIGNSFFVGADLSTSATLLGFAHFP